MEQGTSYSWIIKDTALQNMLNAKHNEVIYSDEFEMDQVTWQIAAYPNGHQSNNIGSFMVFVKLISLPSTWKSIAVMRRIKCDELESCNTFIKQYSIGDGSGWCDGSLLLNEVKNKISNVLTFTITIKILKIKLNDNTILYPTKNKPIKQHNFEWKIPNKILEIMKNSNNGKLFESPIYANMWCLSIYPNKNGNVQIWLQLCDLGENICKLSVNWKVHCKPINITTNKTKDFAYNSSADNWGANKLSFENFKKCDTMTICLSIVINGLYDDVGNDISENSRNSSPPIVSSETKQIIENTNNNYKLLQENINELTEKVAQISAMNINNNILDIKTRLNQLIAKNEKNASDKHKDKLQEIKLWLQNDVQLPGYYTNFKESGFMNLSTICNVISLPMLHGIGITKPGHQQEILQHAQQYKNKYYNNHNSNTNDNNNQYLMNVIRQQHTEEIEKMNKIHHRKLNEMKEAIKKTLNCFITTDPRQYLKSFWVRCNELRSIVEKQSKDGITFIDDEDKLYDLHIMEYIKQNDGKNLNHQMIINYETKRKKSAATKQSKIIKILQINNHKRVPILNGQKGLKSIVRIGKGSVLGEYSAKYTLESDLDRISDTLLYHKISKFGFNANINNVTLSLDKIKYFLSANTKKRKRSNNNITNGEPSNSKKQRLNNSAALNRNHNSNYNEENGNDSNDEGIGEEKMNHSFKIVIDGFSVKSMLRFMNDCRKDWHTSEPTQNDKEYYNVKLVTVNCKGWPRIFGVAIRDIQPNEELLSFYGNYIGVEKEIIKLNHRNNELKEILASVGMENDVPSFD